jgi:hypothetical protein
MTQIKYLNDNITVWIKMIYIVNSAEAFFLGGRIASVGCSSIVFCRNNGNRVHRLDARLTSIHVGNLKLQQDTSS